MALVFGVIVIIVGLGLIVWTYKNPNEMNIQEAKGLSSPDYQGYLIGIALIAGGITLIKSII